MSIGETNRPAVPAQPRSANFDLLLTLFLRFRRETLITLGAALAATVLGWSLALLVQVLIDSGPTLSVSQLYIFGGAVGVALAFRSAYNALRDVVRVTITRSISDSMGEGYIQHSFRLPVAAYRALGSDTLEIATRFREIRDAREAVSEAILTIALDLLLASGTMVLLLWRSPRIALALLVLVPVLPFLARVFRRMTLRREHARYDAGVRTMGRFAEMLVDPLTVRAYGADEWAIGRVVEPYREEIEWESAARLAGGWARSALELATSLLHLAVLMVGGTQMLAGAMTPGELMFTYGLAAQLLGPVERLANLAPRLQRAGVAWGRIAEVFQLHREGGGAVPIRLRGKIELRNVTFGYRPEHPVLHDIQLTMEPGSIVAIVGESGSGKTTLANLLTGAYVPDRGEILVDGLDLRHAELASYRRSLGTVFHRTSLFNASVRENVALGRPQVTSHEVITACRAACAHDFIVQLPDGYETRLSDRDHGLSGGQVQRLGIARALAGAPKVFILDEATSNLDSITEAAVLSAVMADRTKRTSIIIAHRLGTISTADNIVVLHDGHIAEQGTHRQLLAARGRYYDLLCRQLAGFEASSRTQVAFEEKERLCR